MKKFYKNLSTSVLAIAFVFGFISPISVQAATAPSLGTASSFSVLAKPTMTAANPTTIFGVLVLSTFAIVLGRKKLKA